MDVGVFLCYPQTLTHVHSSLFLRMLPHVVFDSPFVEHVICVCVNSLLAALYRVKYAVQTSLLIHKPHTEINGK